MDDKKSKRLQNMAFITLGIAIFITGIYFGVNITTYLKAIVISFIAIFLALILFIILIIAIPIVKDISNPDPVIDSTTLFLKTQIRKYPLFWAKLILVLFILLMIAGIVLEFFLHTASPDTMLKISFIKLYLQIFTALTITLIFIVVLLMGSAITETSKISTILSKEISDEFVEHNPQESIIRAFNIFEDHLRKKLKKHGKLREKSNLSSKDLIQEAFGNKGYFDYRGLRKSEKNYETYELVLSIYEKFRHPRAHGLKEDDVKTAVIAIKLVDVLIRIVDESKERTSSNDGENKVDLPNVNQSN